MHYRVFLDTNIYIGEGYSFHGSKFSRIKDLSDKGFITLVTNDIVEHEVREHIEKDLKRSIPALSKAYGDHSLAFFKSNGFLNLTEAMVPENWIQTCQQEYGLYLGECEAVNTKCGSLDGNKIKEAFLSKQAPFTPDKPEEFKDAFILAELVNDIIRATYPGEIQYCVVSKDTGFREGLTRLLSESASQEVIDSVAVYESLSAFCDSVVTTIEQQAAFLKALLSDSGQEEAQMDYIAELMQTADFVFESDEYFGEPMLEEFELLSIGEMRIEPRIIDLERPNSNGKKYAAVAFDVSCKIKVRYSWIDDQESFYDLDGDFHAKMIKETASYRVKFEFERLYNYENSVVPDDWAPNCEYDFSNFSLVSDSKNVEPLRIEMNRDAKLDSEISEQYEN